MSAFWRRISSEIAAGSKSLGSNMQNPTGCAGGTRLR
jgi:hypothetical protein